MAKFILIHGESGIGKTLLAERIQSTVELPFAQVVLIDDPHPNDLRLPPGREKSEHLIFVATSNQPQEEWIAAADAVIHLKSNAFADGLHERKAGALIAQLSGGEEDLPPFLRDMLNPNLARAYLSALPQRNQEGIFELIVLANGERSLEQKMFVYNLVTKGQMIALSPEAAAAPQVQDSLNTLMQVVRHLNPEYREPKCIDELGLRARTLSTLHQAGITTLEELLICRAVDLLEFRNLGKSKLDEIIDKLSEVGLHLRN